MPDREWHLVMKDLDGKVWKEFDDAHPTPYWEFHEATGIRRFKCLGLDETAATVTYEEERTFYGLKEGPDGVGRIEL